MGIRKYNWEKTPTKYHDETPHTAFLIIELKALCRRKGWGKSHMTEKETEAEILNMT